MLFRFFFLPYLQVTGDAEYLNDLEAGSELYGAFVLSTVASAKLKSIDETKALAMRGVIVFISAKTVDAEGYCNIVRCQAVEI